MTGIVQNNCGVSKHNGETLVLPCNHSVCKQCWFSTIVSGRANCAYCEFTSDDLHKFAEQKNTHACYILGRMYHNGEGVEKNLLLARDMYEIAIQDDTCYENAFNNLAIVYAILYNNFQDLTSVKISNNLTKGLTSTVNVFKLIKICKYVKDYDNVHKLIDTGIKILHKELQTSVVSVTKKDSKNLKTKRRNPTVDLDRLYVEKYEGVLDEEVIDDMFNDDGKFYKVVNSLKDCNFPLDVPDRSDKYTLAYAGDYLIHRVCRTYRYSLLVSLLDIGANPNMIKFDGDRPLDILVREYGSFVSRIKTLENRVKRIDDCINNNDYERFDDKKLELIFRMARKNYREELEKGLGFEVNFRTAKGLLINEVSETRILLTKVEASIDLLLSRGADASASLLNIVTSLNIFSKSSDKIIEVLINNGANVNACNNYGQTPLHNAILSKSSDKIIEVLINNGANVNARNNYGQTPLHYIDKTSVENIRLLIKNGADPNAKDDDGDVPLCNAFCIKVNKYFNETQKIEIILELLKNGADIKMANNKGELPFEKAIDEGVCSADTIYNILKKTNADASILMCVKLLSKNKQQTPK